MPSTAKMLFDLTVSGAILAGGAWLAATISTPAVGADASASPPVQGLQVDITGTRNDVGNVIVMVFDAEDAYAAYDFEKTVGFQELAARPQTLTVTFRDLTSGPYAVMMFHDENGDYDLNMNGDWPTEGYGTSGAKGPFDAPSFTQAAVGPGVTTVQMYYLD